MHQLGVQRSLCHLAMHASCAGGVGCGCTTLLILLQHDTADGMHCVLTLSCSHNVLQLSMPTEAAWQDGKLFGEACTATASLQDWDQDCVSHEHGGMAQAECACRHGDHVQQALPSDAQSTLSKDVHQLRKDLPRQVLLHTRQYAFNDCLGGNTRLNIFWEVVRPGPAGRRCGWCWGSAHHQTAASHCNTRPPLPALASAPDLPAAPRSSLPHPHLWHRYLALATLQTTMSR